MHATNCWKRFCPSVPGVVKVTMTKQPNSSVMQVCFAMCLPHPNCPANTLTPSFKCKNKTRKNSFFLEKFIKKPRTCLSSIPQPLLDCHLLQIDRQVGLANQRRPPSFAWHTEPFSFKGHENSTTDSCAFLTFSAFQAPACDIGFAFVPHLTLPATFQRLFYPHHEDSKSVRYHHFEDSARRQLLDDELAHQ